MNIIDCVNYNFSYYDLVIPRIEIFYKLCVIRDKTNMFLISIIRLFIILMIFHYLSNKKIIEWNMNTPIKTLLFSMTIVFLMANIVYLIVLLYKIPAIDEKQLEEETTKNAKYYYDIQFTKPVKQEDISAAQETWTSSQETRNGLKLI